jgi:hypothetical protein
MAVRVSMTIRAMGDAQGLVRNEFIPEGLTVNKEMRFEILRRLRDAARRKCSQIWTINFESKFENISFSNFESKFEKEMFSNLDSKLLVSSARQHTCI